MNSFSSDKENSIDEFQNSNSNITLEELMQNISEKSFSLKAIPFLLLATIDRELAQTLSSFKIIINLDQSIVEFRLSDPLSNVFDRLYCRCHNINSNLLEIFREKRENEIECFS